MTTKEKFLEVYNRHLPNGYVRFVYRYFSLNTKNNDRWLSRVIKWIFICAIFVGFVSIIITGDNTPSNDVAFVATMYVGYILLLLATMIIVAAIINNFRIRKIIRELGIGWDEYNICVSIYVEE
jgi:hypothetical protein